MKSLPAASLYSGYCTGIPILYKKTGCVEKMRSDICVILVDDDDINNYLSKVILEDFLPPENIKEFTSPLTLLNYLPGQLREAGIKRCIFFVDINMPGMSGWELIRQLKNMELFDFGRKDLIYVLSSSVNQRDRERVEMESSIHGFIEKPISLNKVESLLKAEKAD